MFYRELGKVTSLPNGIAMIFTQIAGNDANAVAGKRERDIHPVQSPFQHGGVCRTIAPEPDRLVLISQVTITEHREKTLNMVHVPAADIPAESAASEHVRHVFHVADIPFADIAVISLPLNMSAISVTLLTFHSLISPLNVLNLLKSSRMFLIADVSMQFRSAWQP